MILFAASLCAAETIEFTARSQQQDPSTEGVWRSVETKTSWDPAKTCVIICDMWNKHWCDGATERVGEMVPRMNALLNALRRDGVLVIHAPSGTMDYYKQMPQRQRAIDAPYSKPPVEIAGWCYLDLNDESALPIDDSDGGCDRDGDNVQYTAWTMEHPGLELAPEDAVSDDGQEIYNLMAQQGIDNVIMMGVHLNMCVLGRPFGIRQLKRLGKNVVLVRDLTDTMYNPKMPPYVDHETGTKLVVMHVEKYWAPSTTSRDLMDEISGSK
ncbi:MAG: protein-signal peptide and transmembrane prediction [bacterium]|nr:protein-signal peptide and transmembrane prediction [bacterium]